LLFANRSQGFTLIELLVASVILISAISLSQIAFSQYSTLINKQSGTSDRYLAVMQAKNQIDLNDNIEQLNGQFTFKNYQVEWQGEIIEQFRPKTYEADLNAYSTTNKEYFLVGYTLSLTDNGVSTELNLPYNRFFIIRDKNIVTE